MNKENNKNLPATIESQHNFARFEQLDDKLIIKELENQVVDDWVYHFVVEGHHIWGLSKVGIDACTRRMGEKGIALREDSIDFVVDPTNPEYVLFTAKVSKHVVSKEGLEATIESSIGTKRQWIMIKRRGEGERKIISNKFWYEQGSMKALRNAKARLIPEDIKTKVIEFAKQHKKVHEIEAPVAQKRAETKMPLEKKSESSSTASEFPKEKEGKLGFPPDTKEEAQAAMPLQKETMELTGLEATLVDKHGFTPDTIIEKLNQMFGESELTKLTKEQTKEGIKYFKDTIEQLNKCTEKE